MAAAGGQTECVNVDKYSPAKASTMTILDPLITRRVFFAERGRYAQTISGTSAPDAGQIHIKKKAHQ
jgi:hypothetical protein